MRIITIDLEKETVSRFPVVACIGFFDGMHKGHQALIRETLKMAKELCCEPGLITFEPDPWVTIRGLRHIPHISSVSQRVDLAVRFGIDNIFILKFTPEMAALSPVEFEEKVLKRMNLQGLVCGFDFHYGAKGAGNSTRLREVYQERLRVVPAVEDDNGKISSSRIEQLIVSGDMPYVEQLLGYPYEICGKVVHGKHVGKKELGFPTINIRPIAEYIIPRSGVYAGYAVVRGEVYRAMINIGHNPTMNYTEQLSMEAYLLDFSADIYHEKVCIRFKKFLRPEIRFRSVGNLILQLEQDERDTRELLEL